MASPFVDKVTIQVRAGDGGAGAVAFHREKYVAAGGPDGGDGGRGGNIVFTVDDHMSTLMDFRYKRKFAAGNGQPGQGKRCSGKDGESIVLKVPRGTVLRDADSGAIMHDMSSGEDYVACRGGRGGWGNKHFATPTRQVPRFAKPGLPGEAHTITLELKLLADVGLVGFPNVGKSTLLSVVSNAHPKIANYHFTTLFPNLGVVYVDEGVSFVLADIPGIIEGASDGAGLGHDFLRHIDRCRLLIHLVDVSGSEGRDPVEDFEAINAELAQYNAELASRPQLVAANKCDLLEPGSDNLERLRAHVEGKGLRLFELSAASTQGTRELMRAAAGELAAPAARHGVRAGLRPARAGARHGGRRADTARGRRLVRRGRVAGTAGGHGELLRLREPHVLSTAACAAPASSTAWRPWASATGTRSASTI